MPTPWTQRCPQGHSAIEIRKAGYYCQSCNARYPGDPHDARETEFPVSDAGDQTELNVRTAVADLASICEQESRTAAKLSELDCGTTGMKREALQKAEAQGFVKRDRRSAGDWYRPTETGWRIVRGPRDSAGRFITEGEA